MKKNEFLIGLQDVLEIDEKISENDKFNDVCEWDSLARLGILAYFDELGLEINIEKLNDIDSVSELIKIAGEFLDEQNP